ncbi:hypothetical protein JCM10449v2_007255 [Rhodotorula kratochvilovae]
MPPAKRTKAELLRASASNAAKRAPAARPPPPPVPAAAPQQSLPKQILACIVSHIDPLHPEGLTSLLRLCRTSKALRAVARPALYRILPVYNQRDKCHSALSFLLDKFLELSDKPRPAPPANDDDTGVLDRGAQRLLRALKADPARAALVEEVVFYGPIPGENPAGAMRRVLDICRDVKAVRLVEHEPPDVYERRNDEDEWDREAGPCVLKVVHERFPDLKRLAVRGIHPDDQEYTLCLLAPFKDLEHLELKCSQFDRGYLDWADSTFGQAAGVEFTWRLKSLDLPNSMDDTLFDRLTLSSTETLESLGIGIRADALDLSDFVRVAHLTIAYSRPSVVAATLATAPTTVRVLELREDGDLTYADAREARFNRDSEEYELDSDGDPVSPSGSDAGDDDERYATMLASVPATVQHLRITSYLGKEEEADLLRALADPAWAPQLGVLDLADEALGDNGWMDDLPRAERKEAKAEFKKVREKVRKACAKRGVRLGPAVPHWKEDENDEGKVPRMLL